MKLMATLALALLLSACGGGGDSSSATTGATDGTTTTPSTAGGTTTPSTPGGTTTTPTTPGGTTTATQQPIASYVGVWKSGCTFLGGNTSTKAMLTLTGVAGSTASLNLVSDYTDYTNSNCSGAGTSGSDTGTISYSTDAVKTKAASDGTTVDKVDIIVPNRAVIRAIFQLSNSNTTLRVGFPGGNQLDASGYANNLNETYAKQ